MTLPRGRSGANGKHGHVVDYRHVIHALRASRWRCSASSTAISSSRARPTGGCSTFLERCPSARLQADGGAAEPRARAGLRGASWRCARRHLEHGRLPDLAAARPLRARSGALPEVVGAARAAERSYDVLMQTELGGRGMNEHFDAARLTLLLNELRLPPPSTSGPLRRTVRQGGLAAARFLAAIAEHELAERDRRRIERHLAEARCCPARRWTTSTSTPCP
jgi:hypothetical protein